MSEWTFGELTLRAEALDSDGNIVVLAEAPISADGAFTLSLPTTSESFPQVLNEYNDSTCQEVFESLELPVLEVTGPGHLVTPDPLVQTAIDIYAYQDAYPDVPYIMLINSDDRADGFTDVTYRFSETAGTYTGGCAGTYAPDEEDPDAKPETFSFTYDQTYVAGWNTELYAAEYTDTGRVTVGTVGPIPAEVEWIYFVNDEYPPTSGGATVSPSSLSRQHVSERWGR